MSNKQNTEILENAKADFDALIQAHEYKAAKIVIDYLLDQGFTKEAMELGIQLAAAQTHLDMPKLAGLEYVPVTQEMEEQFQERRAKNLEFLKEKGRTEGDVMQDDQGAYVFLEEETGLKKTYLPFANEIDMVF